MLEYRCGVCEKLWPSWRSVITHYSKSDCRLVTSTISPSITTITQASSSIIDHGRENVGIVSTTTSTLVAAVDEECEADEQVDRQRTPKSKSAQNKKKVEKQHHSPSVEPKERADNDVSSSSIQMPSHGDGTNDDDGNDSPLICGTTNTMTDVDSKATGTGRKYCCKYCASGGWDKQVSLSQHMRHMHKSE